MESINHHLDQDTLSDQSPSHPKIGSKNSYQKNKEKKPKRNKSAFILFSIEQRAKFKSAFQDQINSNEMMVKLAETWKQLPKEEREKFETEAKNDKMRYLREVENFSKTHPEETIHNKTKKNHVKKPCSAYALFLKETKKVIKAEAPQLKMADVLKVVSEKWKNLNENDRAIFQERAKVEKDIVKALLDQKVLKESTRINTVRPASVAVPEMVPAKKLCQESDKTSKTHSEELQDKIKVEDQVKIEAMNLASTASSSLTPSDSSCIKEEASGFDEIAKRMHSQHFLNPTSSLSDISENQNKMLLDFFNVTFRKSTELFSEFVMAQERYNMMRSPMTSFFTPFNMRNCQPASNRSKIINNVIISALNDTKEP